MPSRLRSIALSSLALLMVCTAQAANRPRYGGTLRVELRSLIRSIDPVEEPSSPLATLVFDTLVTLDASARAQAGLAVSWTQESDRRWRLVLRHGVTCPDGTPVTSAVVAASLRNGNPEWAVREAGETLTIETDQPSPDLLGRLALPRNSVVVRNDGSVCGTGPFTVAEWQSGRAVLQARDDGWHARPFVDRIEVLFGRSLRDQSVDMDLGRADVIEAAPEERPQGVRRILRSDPAMLWALRFSHTNPVVRDARVREAVSLAIDRESIATILLQRRGEATGGLLPNWMTGYAFLFASRPQVARARQLRVESRTAAPMTLVYRAADPMARLIAERIVLNAADAGLTVRTAPDTQNISVPDMELVTIRLPSTDSLTALASLSRPGVLALPYVAPSDASPDDVYRATAAALKDTWAAPIVYAPVAYAVSPRVLNWNMSRAGEWELESVYLAPEVGR